MDIQIGIRGEIVILSLIGKLDARTDAKFNTEVNRLIQKNFNLIFIEMSKLTFLDSTGLGACMKAHRAAREKGGVIIFVSPSEPVNKVFRITGADSIFNISSSKTDAFTMIRKGEEKCLQN